MKKIFFTIIAITAIVAAVKIFTKSDDLNLYNDSSADNFSADSFSTDSFSADDNTDFTDDWRLILVNNQNAIPENYNVDLVQLSNGVSVDSRIYPDLQQMFDDARKEGIYPVVTEGYRTNQQQQDMMNEKVDSFINEGYSLEVAQNLALDWVALPGKSEHELGIALDINADADFCSDNDVYDWLADNAYKYGFILRYPCGKEYITGIDYEPWHYRYVGTDYASQIYSKRITLEEFLDVE